jgi:hypothetical protein
LWHNSDVQRIERERERTVERGSGGQVTFKLKEACDELQQIRAQLRR